MSEVFDMENERLRKEKVLEVLQEKHNNHISKQSEHEISPCIDCENFSYYGCIKSDSCKSFKRWLDEKSKFRTSQ